MVVHRAVIVQLLLGSRPDSNVNVCGRRSSHAQHQAILEHQEGVGELNFDAIWRQPQIH